jgi:guanylate kinase
MQNSEKKRTGKLGVAVIVSGPSGTGKSTVCDELKKLVPDLGFSISCTTRSPRPGEEDGREYYFISRDEFKSKIDKNLFIEYAEVHGNFYGTLRSEVIDRVSAGRDVVLDIDVQGAMKIKKYAESDELLADSLELVFIGPPSFEELENRLRSRATETEEAIQLRLKNAESELEQWHKYEYLIINNELDEAVSDMKAFLDIMHKSTKRLTNPGFSRQIQ